MPAQTSATRLDLPADVAARLCHEVEQLPERYLTETTRSGFELGELTERQRVRIRYVAEPDHRG